MASTPTRLQHLSADLLALPARYSARVVARDRLRRVLAAPAVGEPSAADALHDFHVALRRLRTWLSAFGPELDDTVGRGTLRRLRRGSRRTGQARDCELRRLWLAHPTNRLGPLAAQAAASLADRLRLEQAAAHAEALQWISAELPGAGRKLDKQLRRYEVRVQFESDQHDPTMAEALGRLLRAGGEQVRATLDQVTSPQHLMAVHQARLAVEHLRYLLESLADTYRGGSRAVDRLSHLQDALGLLHDRQVLLDRVAEEIQLHDGARGKLPATAAEAATRLPTRRAFTALHAALQRGANSEFRKVVRLCHGRGTKAALATVDRLAVLLCGPGALDAAAPVQPLEAADARRPPEVEAQPMTPSPLPTLEP